MKINLKKVKELEKRYQNDPISLNSLQNMMNIVLGDYKITDTRTNVNIAIITLKDLGVLEEDSPLSPKLQQLNS